MKKILTITLLVLLTVGLFVSCNADAVETVFDTSYKVQADGSWKMGNKVYEPSTKPYILVLPKTLNIEKDVQLADLEAGMKTLEEIKELATETDIGNATIVFVPEEGSNPQYYKYVNDGDETKAQQILMRTTDEDYTETILLKAPHDEFSHYGLLNMATVGEIAQQSYYEYGYVRKIILSIGHLVAKQQSEIDVIIVNSNDTSKVSVDVETTKVKGVVAPEEVFSKINTPASVSTFETEDAKFMDENGNFYSTFPTDITSDKVTLIGNVGNLNIKQSVEIDMFGNDITGTVSIDGDCAVTFTDSIGDGKLVKIPTGDGTFEVNLGNYGFDPRGNLADKENTTVKKIGDYYCVRKKVVKPAIPYTGLCFTAEKEGATVALKKTGNPGDIELIYSTDGVNYQDYTIGEVISATDIGAKVYFRAKDYNATFSAKGSNYYGFVLGGEKVSCSGNIMYLLDADGTKTSVPEYAFAYLFNGCSSLTSVPELPATTLAEDCYENMFSGCNGLTSLPKGLLPATELAKYCYGYMFSGCTGLTELPEGLLPETKLADYCYDDMFYGCTGLTSLPAGLLPATELANGCYEYMFQNCTSLTELPEELLPAPTLAEYCYYCMFEGCTGLTELPEELLPATKLAEGCYLEMFENCTLLTTAPALPATELVKRCYESMFKVCTSLVAAPDLPATDLKEACYKSMFEGCTSLVTAPDLPATTLAEDCYENMFYGCSALNSVSVNFTEWNDDIDATENWLKNTNTSTGTFKCPSALCNAGTTGGDNFGNNKIPSTWTVENNAYTVTFDINGATDTVPTQTVKKDGKVEKPADPSVSGYIFEGWYKEADCTNEWNFDDTVSEDITLYAKVSYTVIGLFGTAEKQPTETKPWKNSDDYSCYLTGSDMCLKKGQDVKTFTLSDNLAAEKKGDSTWEFVLTGTGVVLTFTQEEGKLTKIKVANAGTGYDGEYVSGYTVSFDLNGQSGTTPDPVFVYVGEKATKPNNPTVSGKILVGWYTDAACTTEWVFDTNTVTAAITLYAKWEDSVTVSFDLNGHTVFSSYANYYAAQTVAKNGKATAPSSEGMLKSIEGWYKEAACTNKWDFDDPVTENTILYAKWKDDIGGVITTLEKLPEQASPWKEETNNSLTCYILYGDELWFKGTNLSNYSSLTTATTDSSGNRVCYKTNTKTTITFVMEDGKLIRIEYFSTDASFSGLNGTYKP